ncbi:acyl-CoA thioesterase [Tautonia plasticadhaerens]|uniref:Acyl-CoA thioester hydrolase YbgC n=1 Tax=Tautonia plasticadhaerens TaxID=2527974 RepID=A0A518GW30_9BACT|nr:thioesterase family protein [Tautonia plasticadhaerens]QDV32794.1 Acyl-CoA thioester hydrolase YbgC [Tautonia plasticadhaerens]
MAEPRVFEHPVTVGPRDIDRMGHVNNVVYLRYAQDAAVAHWKAVVTGELAEALLWVARRHEIDYLKPALPGDELVARTWVGMADGATFERFVEILRPSDDRLLTKVRTLWVAVDPRSHRPRRIPEAMVRLFEEWSGSGVADGGDGG